MYMPLWPTACLPLFLFFFFVFRSACFSVCTWFCLLICLVFGRFHISIFSAVVQAVVHQRVRSSARPMFFLLRFLILFDQSQPHLIFARRLLALHWLKESSSLSTFSNSYSLFIRSPISFGAFCLSFIRPRKNLKPAVHKYHSYRLL